MIQVWKHIFKTGWQARTLFYRFTKCLCTHEILGFSLTLMPCFYAISPTPLQLHKFSCVSQALPHPHHPQFSSYQERYLKIKKPQWPSRFVWWEEIQMREDLEGRCGWGGGLHGACCAALGWSACLTLCNPMDCNPPGSSVHGDSPGKNTGVSSLSLLQGNFPTQGSNPGLPHCRWILHQMSQQGSPRTLEWVACPFSRGPSPSRNQTGVSCIAGGFLTSWATREDHRPYRPT